MKKRISSTALGWILIALAGLLVPKPLSAASFQYTFEIFSIPGDGQIIGRDINDGNDVVGLVDHFVSGSRKPTGFVRRGDNISLIDFPGSESLNGTRALGINNAGQIVGRFSEVTSRLETHGFTLDNGVLQQFDVPDSRFTEAFDISNNGLIVGRTFLESDPGIGTAFIRNGDDYTFFRPEGVRGPFGIQFEGVNDRDNTVGSVLDGTGFRAFAVLDGAYMPFSIPESTRTTATGINNANQIVGFFRDRSGINHGFLMDATGIYQIDVLAPDSDGTFLTGINEDGFLVGAVGFRRFPVREVLLGSPCDEVSDTCLAAPRIGDPVIEFPLSPVAVCIDVTISAGSDCTASASIDAGSFDPDGDHLTLSQDPPGPYGLGDTHVTLTATNAGGNQSTCEATVTVVDTTPPVVLISMEPQTLWPPNHRMIDVSVSVLSSDACSTAGMVLTSVTSSDADNGDGGGDTVNDIQDVELGTADVQFKLRAERAGGGGGRIYTAVYKATDGSGNEASAAGYVLVPHDQGGKIDPINVSVEENAFGTIVRWNPVYGAETYNAIRGTVNSMRVAGPMIDLGAVECIEKSSPDESTQGYEDSETPKLGEAFFYLVEYSDGTNSSYGTESVGKPRSVGLGDCQ